MSNAADSCATNRGISLTASHGFINAIEIFHKKISQKICVVK